MNLICALSNKIVNEPVISPVSGNVFERKLILEYLEQNNCDPINGKKLDKNQLININLFKNDNQKIKTKINYSSNQLIKYLQDEWDSMKIQIFQLKKQLISSNRDIELLINQQKDSNKIISSLTNELNRYRKLEQNEHNKLNDNLYINLISIDSNKENINSLSINSSSNKSSSLKNELLDQNRFNYLLDRSNNLSNLIDNKQLNEHHLSNNNLIINRSNSTINHSINSKFSDHNLNNHLNTTKFNNLKQHQSIQNYNKQISLSTEYINLNNKLIDRNSRTQSVIIQNDNLFDLTNNNQLELNKIKSYDENLNNFKLNEYKNLDFLNDNQFLRSYSTQLTSSSNDSLKGSINKLLFNNVNENLYENKLDNNLLNEDLYCNLKEFNQLNRLNSDIRQSNYENIIIYDEDFSSQQSINKLEILNNEFNNLNNKNKLINNFNLNKITSSSKISRVESWSKDFNNLLNDQFGINAFTQFLISEHSEENIKFWEHCEHFKRLTKNDELKKEAKIIFKKFFDSKNEKLDKNYRYDNKYKNINVIASIKEEVEKNYLNNVTINLFDNAQQEIFNLMKNDCYRRFLNSKMYKQLLEDDKKKLLPIQLINKPISPTNQKQKQKRKSFGFKNWKNLK